MDYDVFISHASEDKEAVARPLARHLQKLGLRVWIDECELTLGDSLRRKIDTGLSQSQYGVVVLSPAFFGKEWPNKELDGLVAREDGSGKVVLPIWHNVNASDVLRHSPLLAAKIAVSTIRGIPEVAASVYAAVKRTPDEKNDPNAKLASVESESLEQVRREMLTASSSHELRRSIYVLEGHLARYPYSFGIGRLLVGAVVALTVLYASLRYFGVV
jgi:TIR domain